MVNQRGAEAMTSRECVRRAIEFDRPGWIPCNFDKELMPVLPEGEANYGDDIIWVFASADPDFKSTVDPAVERESEWGGVYRNIGATLGLPTRFPLADVRDLSRLRRPDYAKPARYTELEKAVAANPDKYMLGMFPHFLFMTMLELVGFENLMTAFVDYEEEVDRIIRLLTDSCLVVVNEMHKRGVNGIIAIEDLGVQDRLIISPAMWRRFYKRAYKEIIDNMHSLGMHFFIHCCGYIIDILEDFIGIGVDVAQLDQQYNMGIENLSRRYGGRLCFYCPCDIQRTLPSGTPQMIEENVKQLISELGGKNGGFIAKTYPQPEACDIPYENNALMCSLFHKYGKYPYYSNGRLL